MSDPRVSDATVFDRALACAPGERGALLAELCADAEQRGRIERLLRADEAAAGFLLVAPDVPAEFARAAGSEQVGDRIGRYRLAEKIGEGGCGVVYRAEQLEPVRRDVALKVIKLGMDTLSVIARFEAERQALAMMDHPNIARVFDAGATETGRPFFVMELVHGVPITKFCDEHNLPLATRLELFVQVCHAIQHAHQKGVIHRDVKPSNVLVAPHDGAPVPKVIDFGIAKATQGRLADSAVVTAVEQFVGTPAYMSPEQAERGGADLDTRTDIYSLGVLLYELITGRTPFETRTLGEAGVDELRRIICEVEPPRPSARLSTLTHVDREAIARLRGTAVFQLRTELRGDLDWIVMRCLEKDRARRYGTAHDLAADITRYLRHEPIEARPPGAGYRVRKFIVRHRYACAAIAAVASVLIAGSVVSTWQAIRARRAERQAIAQRDLATAANQAAALARDDAQRRQEQAEDLLAFMLGNFRTELKKIGQLKLLDAIGDKATEYFAALNPRDLSDTALARQAKALTQIGENRMDEANYQDAEQSFTAAYTRAAALAARRPRDGDMLFERGQAEYWLGVVGRRRGDLGAASLWLTRYRDTALQLVALNPAKDAWQEELAYGHNNLAVLDVDQGRFEAARTGFRAALEIMAKRSAAKPDDLAPQSNVANMLSWLGTVAERSGDYAEARARFADHTRRIESLVKMEPAAMRWKARLAEALGLEAYVALITDRRGDARALLARAREMTDAAVQRDPANQTWFKTSLNLRLGEASLLLADGEISAAMPMADEARRGYEKLMKAEPSDRGFVEKLARAWRIEGELRLLAGRDDATDASARALSLGNGLVASARPGEIFFGDHLRAIVLAGTIADRRGDRRAAVGYWQRAADATRPLLEHCNDWRVLDPAARAFALLGRDEISRPLVERLDRFGYRPLTPWPAATDNFVPQPAINK